MTTPLAALRKEWKMIGASEIWKSNLLADDHAFVERLFAQAEALERERDELVTALRVIGIEPPEFPDEPWSVSLNENGPEAGGETAIATAELFMDDLTRRETERDALQALLAAAAPTPPEEPK